MPRGKKRQKTDRPTSDEEEEQVKCYLLLMCNLCNFFYLISFYSQNSFHVHVCQQAKKKTKVGNKGSAKRGAKKKSEKKDPPKDGQPNDEQDEGANEPPKKKALPVRYTEKGLWRVHGAVYRVIQFVLCTFLHFLTFS